MAFSKKPLTAAIVGALLSPAGANAATITVNTNSDMLVLMGSSLCTLRLAVQAANSNAAQAGCVAGDVEGADVITFSDALSGATITLTQGQLSIESSVTVEGLGALRRGVTISGNSASRIFRINDYYDDVIQKVTLNDLTLIDGGTTDSSGGAVFNNREYVAINRSTFSSNTVTQTLGPPNFGGAIANRNGEMTINESVISGNSAPRYGGIANLGSSAIMRITDTMVSGNARGGVFNGNLISYDGTPRLIISGGLISNNTNSAYDHAGISGYGLIELTDVSISGHNGSGILIFEDGSSLMITDSIISNNSVNLSGGGIRLQPGTTASLLRTQVLNNTAGEFAGGIFSSGSVTITDSQIVRNTAGAIDENGGGGGVTQSANSTLSIINSRIELNTAPRGAGILSSGNLSISESTISNNSASGSGGGLRVDEVLYMTYSTVANNTAVNGGAIFARNGVSTRLTNTTISGNLAIGESGMLFPAAVYAFGPLTITNSSLIGNAPNAITRADDADNSWSMSNTVIADSTEFDCVDVLVPLTQNVSNFIADGTCAADAVDLLSGDPMVGPLADNGGVTLTHLPLTGSPLVDTGTNASCPGSDQTGMPRPIDGNGDGDPECDIGSIEFVDLFPPLASLTEAPDITIAGATEYDIVVTYSELDGAVDLNTIDASDLVVSPGPLSAESVSISGSPGQILATYTLTPPGGAWAPQDSGVYTISVIADEVLDTAVTGANAVPAGSLGEFSVTIVDIDVTGDGISITDGDTVPSVANGTDFGSVAIGVSHSNTLTITNAGGGTLNLTSALEIFGDGFSLSQPAQTMLGPLQSTQFDVTFTPTSVGTHIGQVIISNNDAEENPYTFAVGGVGVDQPQDDQLFADGFESP